MTPSLRARIGALEATRSHHRLAQWSGRAELAVALASRPDGVELEAHLAQLIADESAPEILRVALEIDRRT